MWPQLIAFVVVMALSYILRPKPTAPSTPQPGDIAAPVVDASSPVPVLFGTRLMESPNCVWYGDVGTTPIVNCSGGKK